MGTHVILGAALLLLGNAGPVSAVWGADGEAAARRGSPNRGGIVVLQFDDGTAGHYAHAFPILEKYQLKGSFGVVTGVFGRPGRLTADQVVQMHRAGHEIHDHTLDHNAAFWGNPEQRAQWEEHIRQSLGILKQLGIETRGWNQPGGKGQAWTAELRATLAPHYDYVAGRVGLRPEEQCNMHWHLKDDPFCLGYGGVSSWSSRPTREETARAVQRMQTQIADGLEQGLVTIPLWHVISDTDGSAWALEEICKFIRAHGLPVMVMAEAVRAVQNPRKYFAPEVQQMPNPQLAADIDGNNRPDGYAGCLFAPAGVKSPGTGRVAEFSNQTSTWIYGPESGRTALALTARSADGQTRAITPVLTFAEIDSNCRYRWREKERCGPMEVGSEWKTATFPLAVDRNVDRVKIEFEVAPAGSVYVAGLSWRLAE